jgi:signal peptide peptidase SppA
MEPIALRNLYSQEKPKRKHTKAKAASQSSATAPQPYNIQGTTAIIPVVGVLEKYPSWLDDFIGLCPTQKIHVAIQTALADPDVEQILLYIDSPGGDVAGTSDLATQIDLAKQIKPVTAYISDLGASAAYWIASACTAIYANESAFIGSIGVYAVILDMSEAAKQAGVSVNLISTGGVKGLLEPGLKVDETALADVQNQIDAIMELFQNAVATGRELSTADVKKLSDGRIHIASDAKELGLIDDIATLDVAISLEGKRMTDKKSLAKADADPNQKPDQNQDNTTPAPAPGDETEKQILTIVQEILQKVNALSDDDDSDDDGDGDGDADAKANKKLEDTMDACDKNAAFAVDMFLKGKTPLEAQAAYATHLKAENANLKKKLALADSDGVDPVALGKGESDADTNSDDPETIWKNDEKIRKVYGKKEFFIAAHKYNEQMKGSK